MEAKTSEWRPGPTVCRCCLTEGCYKDISTEYFWMGKREVYAEMLADTLNLTIAYSQSGGPNSNSRLICEPCISRLRDAADFKRQVQECEKTFLQHLDPSTSGIVAEDVSRESILKGKQVKIELVKLEKDSDDDDFEPSRFTDDDDVDDDIDDQPLTKLAKTPKKETVDLLDLIDNAKVAEKRKSTTKVKATPVKKAKQKKDTKATANQDKPEKKKKEVDLLLEARLNAKVVLEYTTVYPFRLPANAMVCVYCCESYDDPKDYRTHLDVEHAEFKVDTAFAHIYNNYNEYLKVDCENLLCRLCSLAFDDLRSIANHLVNVHSIKMNLSAEIGMQMFKLGAERWVCAICSRKVPCLRSLSRHTTCHYHKYTCETCGKSYSNKENLTRHISFGHSDLKVCMRCKKSFPSCETRREHVLSSKKCWPLCCNICAERFPNRKAKFAHLADVHEQSPKTYTCPECGQEFGKWHMYRTHFVVTHTTNGYQCSYCEQKFDTKRNLLEHRVTHTRERAYQCTVCSKLFGRKKNLQQHMWIHREQKRFECIPCKKQFNQRVSWKSHMKSYHPDLVNF
ncbi:PREDICTED: zinc finger protein 43 isoform X11 [Papilio xuthus]|uniref:Zinc finger protein 43 isoform X11 n=1 Tax=Papilio xuthus TaxID=66420 RepID=A0AAJ7E5K3_PAPXU|nr:PREDICTED: zinc finger protein 43 isoform X11 [Papilio xuthus]